MRIMNAENNKNSKERKSLNFLAIGDPKKPEIEGGLVDIIFRDSRKRFL